jgi:hypothetical protein
MENLFQTRVKEFDLGVQPLKNYISKQNSKSLENVSEIFFNGFQTLGIGELYARQFERESQLELTKARAKFSETMFKRQNEAGLLQILESMNLLKDLKNDFSSIKKAEIKSIQGKLSKVVEEFKLQSIDLEIKGKDTQILFEGIDEIIKKLNSSGIDGVVDHIESKMKELINFRKSADRGAYSNFPVWKIAAIIIGLGVWILAFIRCGVFRCSAAEGTAYVIIFAIAAIVSKFC